MTETALTLVHASKSRGGVLWSKDDYDVYDGERRVIGRIMLHPQARKDRAWFWTITARGRRPTLSDSGYATSREHRATQLCGVTLAESEGLMFGGLNKKAARQSLFNVEINARADLDDKQAFRADTEKILKVEDDLYRDISLALANGASLDQICYRIEIAKIKEATVGLQAKMAIDDFVKVLAAHIKQSA